MFRSLNVIFMFIFLLNANIAKSTSDYQNLRVIEDEFFVILKNKPMLAGEVGFQKNKQYIRTLEDKIEKMGGSVLDSYLYAFVGLHVRLPSQYVPLLAQDTQIAFVEQNAKVELYEDVLAVSSWGIDRIDQRTLPLDQLYETPYLGEEVHSYIIDTGLRATHQEFVGRVGKGYSALDNDSSTNDCNGHGTHVAGTVMGNAVGVARQTMVHPVRVFSCNGGSSWNTIIKAIDWVIANHEKPANINMSLGGGGNQAIDTATANAVKTGISVVVAAGNSNADACNYSPARVAEALTVAASASNDARASFSNWGRCVDIFAPGQSINSASHQGDQQYRSLSGTSMASPHVAGGASLVLGVYPSFSPQEVSELLVKTASMDQIQDVKGSPNKLLYVNQFGAVPTVDAGKDVIQRMPNNTVRLKGRASDSDGSIVEASWSQQSGPTLSSQSLFANWQQSLTLRDLGLGSYVFRFTAKDNDGLVAYDEVKVLITDKNIVPVANAGSDQRVVLGSQVLVNAELSYDLDGQIASYLWQQESGPNEAEFSDPSAQVSEVNNLVAGDYSFKLTVTDNEGASAVDDLHVHVNHPPIVEAGEDQVITLPTNSIRLTASASDPDGETLSYKWIKESGPEGEKILFSDQAESQVENLTEGVYVFRIVVFDDMKDQATDTVKVEVIDPNQAPNVSAGDDVELVLPQNSVTLKGDCQDADGVCVKVSWRYMHTSLQDLDEKQFQQVGSELMLTDLQVGTYDFVFIGEDDLGSQSSDDVRVVVKDAQQLASR